MLPGLDGFDTSFLQWSEPPPSQRVHDVVLDQGIELVKRAQSSREMFSIEFAGMEFLSSVLSSSSRMVRR